MSVDSAVNDAFQVSPGRNGRIMDSTGMRGLWLAAVLGLPAVTGLGGVLSEGDATVAPAGGQVAEYSLRVIWKAGGLDVPEELQFAGPFLVLSVSPGGGVYVLDQTLSTITELDGRTGAFVRRFGRPGRGPGELSAAGSMDWDPWGRLWVAASFDGRYTVFDSAGRLLKTSRRPAHATSRRVFPMAIQRDGTLLDHVSAFPDLRFMRVDTTGQVRDSFAIRLPELDLLTGIIRPGSAVQQVTGLRPFLRWTLTRDGRAIWVSRSDSLVLIQLGATGDTLKAVRHTHRVARFTAEQELAIKRANRELGREGRFASVLVQALHALSDGRLLAQITPREAGSHSEMDLFGADGSYLGVVRSPLDIDHRSELASRGDTLFLPVLGDFDIPMVVKAVIETAGSRGGGGPSKRLRARRVVREYVRTSDIG